MPATTRTPERTLRLKPGQRLFLRMIPLKPLTTIRSATHALDMLLQGGVRPPCITVTAPVYGRNRYGAFVAEHHNDRIECMTQLFLSGELWGIDCFTVWREAIAEYCRVSFGFFDCGSVERVFADTLTSYLAFSASRLRASPPVRVMAGATGVAGYRMSAPHGTQFGGLESYSGYAVQDSITWTTDLDSLEVPARQVLLPFFQHVWDECGLKRPDNERLD